MAIKQRNTLHREIMREAAACSRMKPKWKAPVEAPMVECPRCGESDTRSYGMNKCGLCECEFVVKP